MRYNDEQQAAIFGEEPLIVVAAGAGSGKTKVLTERYVHLCEERLKHELGLPCNEAIGADVESIVALTFTEDAALEMKDRIRQTLTQKLECVNMDYPDDMNQAKSFWRKQVERLDTAVISTFHSYCQRLVSEHTYELGIFPNAKVIGQTESMLVKTEIVYQLLDEAEQTGKWNTIMDVVYEKELQKCLFLVHAKMNEYERTSTIKKALSTNVMFEQWEKMKSAKMDEFQARMEQFFSSSPDTSKLTAATKKTYTHLFNLHKAQLSGEMLYHAGKENLTAVKKKVPDRFKKQNSEFFDVLNVWLEARNMWDNTPTGEDKEYLETVMTEFEELLQAFDEAYQQKKRELAALDFSDLQQKAISILNDPNVRTYYASKFKHFLIDEFQDTNQLQMRMLEKIHPTYSFIVGDSKQSIYRFRGADVQLLNTLVKEAKGEEAARFIDMNINYRTCDSIITFINLLFQEDTLMGTALPENAPLYKTEYTPLLANRNNERERNRRAEYIQITEAQEKSQDENQYVMIARRMIELIKSKEQIYDKDLDVWRPVEWRDMAVLIASRTDLPRLEKALTDVIIPFNVYGGLGFYQRQEVVDFISLLQWVNKPYEPLYMMAVLRSPMFGVTMEEFLEIQDNQADDTLATYIYMQHFRGQHSRYLERKLDQFYHLYKRWVPFHWSAAIRPILNDFFEDSGLKKVLLLQQSNLIKVKNVEKVIDVISNLGASSMDDMLAKLKIIAELQDKEGDADVELTGGNFVHIMTVHASKGLEFPVVFVPNLSKSIPTEREAFRYDEAGGLYVRVEKENEEDLLAEADKIQSPNFEVLNEAAKDQAVEESKRLFYVALTRARDRLILTSPSHGQRNTWFKWLEDSLKTSSELADYIEIKDGVTEQTPVIEKTEDDLAPYEKRERHIPVSFSVSEVVSYMNDPDTFYEKHLLKIDDTWLEEEEMDLELEDKERFKRISNPQVKATTLGTLVHRICELLDKGYQEHAAYQEAFSIFTSEQEADAYRNQVVPLVEVYKKQTLGPSLENEWEFSLNVSGVDIIGEIDKVVMQADGIEVIDLKTNRIHDNIDELISYYKPQLYLYKLAYEREKHTKVIKMSLLFLRDEQQGYYEVEFDAAYEKKLFEAIKEMEQLKKGAIAIG